VIRRAPGRALALAAAAALPAAALAAAPGEPSSPPPPAAWAAAVGVAAEEHRLAQSFPALAVGVVVDGEVAFAAGFGTTRPGGATKVNEHSRFRLASLSKPFTAVALLRLAQAGQLALDDPARRHCPAFASPNGDPTLRQLALHQGGLRHFTDREDTTWAGEVAGLADVVARFGTEELLHAPGERSAYSSPGFVVLGCALESAVGASFFDALAREVLAPAGIAGVIRDRPDLGEAEVVPGFRQKGRKLVPAEVVDTRFKTPASGLVASVAEVARFAAALYGGRLLPAATVASMFVPARAARDEEPLFTLGFQVASNRSRGAALYHAGSMEGATALLYLIPEKRYAVALLASRERAVPDLLPLLETIHGLVLGR
jgi:CubicO group peptidase (beta-lactamase class C family)